MAAPARADRIGLLDHGERQAQGAQAPRGRKAGGTRADDERFGTVWRCVAHVVGAAASRAAARFAAALRAKTMVFSATQCSPVLTVDAILSLRHRVSAIVLAVPPQELDFGAIELADQR